MSVTLKYLPVVKSLSMDELIVLFKRGAQIILGMPKGFYPGYDKEIREVYVYGLSKKR